MKKDFYNGAFIGGMSAFVTYAIALYFKIDSIGALIWIILFDIIILFDRGIK